MSVVQFTEEYRHMGDIDVEPDQVEGINFLLSHPQGILSFGTGLGKTLTSLVAAKILLDKYNNSRCIIVCPVKALKSFKKECFKRVKLKKDEVGIFATNELSYNMQTNKVFIFTDTNIEKYLDVVVELAAKNYKLFLMVDEAHKLQDCKSKFYRVMSQVKKVCVIQWGITATPILNDLDSLYYIVDFFCPKFFGNKTTFNNKYTRWHLEDKYIKGGRKIKTRVIDGYKNLNELNQELKKVMIVRQKQYNLKFGNIYKELTPEELDIYERVSSGMILDISEERAFTKRLHDLQRFVDRAYDNDESIKELVQMYNSSMYSTKETMFLETLKKTVDQGYSVIVYADYTDTINRLHDVIQSKKSELGVENIYEITGSVNIKTREKVEEQISNKDVILITSAGSESINLQAANCVIFYDIPFSVKTIIQVVGRVCRRDTKHKYQYIITLYTKGTVDEYKYINYQNNLKMVQMSVGAGQDLPLEFLDVDQKSLNAIKDKMLWHYKGSDKKEKRKEKRYIKKQITTATVKNAGLEIAQYKFLFEPVVCDNEDIKRVSKLYPDMELFKKYINKEIPLTVFRSKYLEKLRTDESRKLLEKLRNGIAKTSGGVVFVGNTKVPEILKQELLDQYVI